MTHAGTEANQFITGYFSDTRRQVLLVAGAGFDPASTRAATALASVLSGRIRGVFLRERRFASHESAATASVSNTTTLTTLIPRSRVAEFEVFSVDGATVGGWRVVEQLRAENVTDVSDLVVDISALSVGVAFPLVRLLLDMAKKFKKNLHVVVTDDAELDAAVEPSLAEKPEPVHGFKGRLGLNDTSGVSILWLPQLTRRHQRALSRVHGTLNTLPKHHGIDVCPVLPFPSRDPRRADRLIELYREEFESTWRVDARDVVYVDERNPVDLYRTILQIDDMRQRVFRKLDGCLTVLSPFGTKLQSLGALMAAIERDFPVMYVETLAYNAVPAPQAPGELVHVWLHGEAYEGHDVEFPSPSPPPPPPPPDVPARAT